MTALRIGVDARELLGQSTGVGIYLAELLHRWTSRADAAARRFVLYAPERLPLHLPADAVEERTVAGGRGTWWEQTTLRRAVGRDAPDVFFAPAYTAPLGLRLPLALTIHDVSFAAHPEWFRWREGTRRRWLTARSAQAASVIFTDSQFSRAEIERHLGVEPPRIRVVPPGVSPRHRGLPRSREPLVLYVGSLFNRRRVPDLIEAFGQAADAAPDARLVIVGSDRTWPKQDLQAVARAGGVADRIELRSYIDDHELASLYARAAAFVFLSEYEGFGMTPLEALAAGVPAIVLDTPVAREVCGPAAIYVRRHDIAGTAAAIRDLLRDESRAREALAHAGAVLSRYSWDRAADETLSAIERVASRP